MPKTTTRKRRRRKPTSSSGKVRVTVKSYCRRPPNVTIRPGSKRYNDFPF